MYAQQNPYQPPQHNPYQPPQQGYGNPGPSQYRYEPLGWKTTAASIGMIAGVAVGLVVNILPMATSGPPEQNLGLLLVTGLFGLLSAGLTLGTTIVFLMWMHQAAKNVRAFGQQGLEITPGWAVGWWFVPLASLVMPYKAMKEIWQASDPETIGAGNGAAWMSRAVPSLLPIWWATYVGNGIVGGSIAVIQVVSKMGNPAEAQLGRSPLALVAHFLLIIAAVAIVSIMKQLASRQEASASRLSSY